MVNFPDDDRLKPLCPGVNTSKKSLPAHYWQKLAELYIRPNVEPVSLQLWSKGMSDVLFRGFW